MNIKLLFQKMLTYCLAAAGAVWTIYNAAIRLWTPLLPFLNAYYSWILVIFLTCAVAAAILRARRPTKIKLKNLTGNNEFLVRFGDIRKEFSSRKNVNFVIPVNDFFDVMLGEVISDRSVHGQFLQWCSESHEISALERLLEHELASFDFEDIPTKRLGKTRRYPTSAQVCIHIRGNYFYLVPSGRMDPNTLSTTMSWAAYPDTVDRICNFIASKGNGRVTIFPLVGDLMSRTGIPTPVLVEQLIFSIFRSNQQTVIGSPIEVVLYNKKRRLLDLNSVKSWGASIGIS